MFFILRGKALNIKNTKKNERFFIFSIKLKNNKQQLVKHHQSINRVRKRI